MKRVRFVISLVLLTGVLAVVGAVASTSVSALDYSARCSCWYPNSNKYGIKVGSDCVTSDCYIDVN